MIFNFCTKFESNFEFKRSGILVNISKSVPTTGRHLLLAVGDFFDLPGATVAASGRFGMAGPSPRVALESLCPDYKALTSVAVPLFLSSARRRQCLAPRRNSPSSRHHRPIALNISTASSLRTRYARSQHLASF
jgi:hypothetical protein